MKFIVEKEVFKKLPKACFDVVVAKEIDNSKAYPEIDRLLDESIEVAAQHFKNKISKMRRIFYRIVKRSMHWASIPTSIPVLLKHCLPALPKGKGPHINPVADLENAVSLKYTLPMGARFRQRQ